MNSQIGIVLEFKDALLPVVLSICVIFLILLSKNAYKNYQQNCDDKIK
jgi:uncharacterized membrane protein YgaE (UPF0421/DUF939 family)